MIKYNIELLESIIEEYDCIIDIEYYKTIKLHNETNIEFLCKCGSTDKIYNKMFKNIIKSGALCPACLKKKTGLYKNVYDIILLKDIINKYNANVININYYETINLTRDTKIKFICDCNNEYEKTFRNIQEFGFFCKECMDKVKLQKQIKTNLEKYGVEYPTQTTEVQEKTKKTNLERYGVEYSGKLIEMQEKVKNTNIQKYGVEYATQLIETQEKIQNTNMQRYGFKNVNQVPEKKEKSKQTNLIKYGVENVFQNEEIKNKIKQNNIEKYGVEYPIQLKEIQEKGKQTNLEKYGVEYITQSKEIQEKTKKTNLERYGVEHPSQNKEIAEKGSKNAYKLKEFIFPCGNIAKVQGFEIYALQFLIDNNYKYNDLVLSRAEVPDIWYYKDNKKHRYFCDIFIPKENKIIEVKSEWTLECDREKFELKKNSCIENGYNFELWIFDNKKNLKVL